MAIRSDNSINTKNKPSRSSQLGELTSKTRESVTHKANRVKLQGG